MSLGTEWTGARAFARATAFSADYRDFIETKAPDATGTYTYGNIDRGWTRGLEVESGLLVADWRVEAAGERLWTRDQSSGSPLLGRTPWTVRGSLTGPALPSTRVTVRLAYAGRTPVSRDETSGSVQYRDAFPQVDLRLSRLIGTRFELSGEVNNVLDRQLGAQWPGFTGRRAILQLRWRSDALD
jgi:outer membrane receptor protein involved in Fe transport